MWHEIKENSKKKKRTCQPVCEFACSLFGKPRLHNYPVLPFFSFLIIIPQTARDDHQRNVSVISFMHHFRIVVPCRSLISTFFPSLFFFFGCRLGITQIKRQCVSDLHTRVHRWQENSEITSRNKAKTQRNRRENVRTSTCVQGGTKKIRLKKDKTYALLHDK